MVLTEQSPKKIYLGNNELKAVYLGENKVRPSGPDKDYLCFTAEQANSTVKLSKNGSPTSINLETSTDGRTWSDYTFGTDITLSNIGDKVYWRNKSETVTNFSTSTSDYYRFNFTGSIGASGDVDFLLCKNSTTSIPNSYCFYYLFGSHLTKTPKLTATTLQNYCYRRMFFQCQTLEQIPKLNSLILSEGCYYQMFYNCIKIKLSETQTGDYQTEYRIPKEGTGTAGSNALYQMFSTTGGTFKSTPTINKTYYTSNTVV